MTGNQVYKKTNHFSQKRTQHIDFDKMQHKETDYSLFQALAGAQQFHSGLNFPELLEV